MNNFRMNSIDKELKYIGTSVPMSWEEAWQLTREKWEYTRTVIQNRPNTLVGTGARNTCGLCIYASLLDNGNIYSCRGCPVREYTQNYGCQGTPYSKFHLTLREYNEGAAPLSELVTATDRVLEFIEEVYKWTG